MKKYTKAQINRSLKKLAKAIGKTNIIRADDMTDTQRWICVMDAAFRVIEKTGHIKTYYKAVGDSRGGEG